MSLDALSASIASVSLANGDDGIALLQALQGSRCEQMAKAADEARTTLLHHITRMQSILAADLPSRLQALADTPDGQGKILYNLPADPAGTISDDINGLGFTLASETWVNMSSRTYDTSGNLQTSQSRAPTSPDDIAKIRENGQLVSTSGSVDHYTLTTGTGASAQTAYIYVYNNEGQVRASNSGIALLDAQVVGAVVELMGDIQMDTARLDGFSGRLSKTMMGEQPLMNSAKQDDARHQANLKSVQQDSQRTPSA